MTYAVDIGSWLSCKWSNWLVTVKRGEGRRGYQIFSAPCWKREEIRSRHNRLSNDLYSSFSGLLGRDLVLAPIFGRSQQIDRCYDYSKPIQLFRIWKLKSWDEGMWDICWDVCTFLNRTSGYSLCILVCRSINKKWLGSWQIQPVQSKFESIETRKGGVRGTLKLFLLYFSRSCILLTARTTVAISIYWIEAELNPLLCLLISID